MSGETINFFKGYASNNLFPKSHIDKAYSKVLLTTDYNKYDTDPDNQNPLNYGTDPGNLDTRISISKFLHHHFPIPQPDPDCLSLTNGASFGIGIILNRATHPRYTQRIFVVSPCYYLINYAFADAGFGGKISSINETPDSEYSIDFDFLSTELEKVDKLPVPDDLATGFEPDVCGRKDRKIYKSAIYIVPSFSNPGGLTYSEATKKKLLELARKHDMLVICDDVYDLLDYKQSPKPRLVHMDRQSATNPYGNVVSNSSTSKIVAPGLRFGWLETVGKDLAFQFSQEGCTKSGGTPSQLSSYVINELMVSGTINDIIDNFKHHYSKRAQTMKSAINKYLPSTTKFYGGEGGYFIWVVLDPKYDLISIINTLKDDHNIILASGTNFEVVDNQQGWSNCVRLCFSFLTSEQIEQGIKVWGTLLV